MSNGIWVISDEEPAPPPPPPAPLPPIHVWRELYGLRNIDAPSPHEVSLTNTILDKVIPVNYGARTVVGSIGAYEYGGIADGKLRLGIVFAYGEQDSITDLRINGESATWLAAQDNPWVTWVNTHVGDGSTALSIVLTDMDGWTSDDTTLWKGLCHAAFIVNTHSGTCPGSFRIEADLGGQIITDFRDSGTDAYSNPVLVAYDIMTAARWRGLATTRVHENSWEDVADWCDETVGGETRFKFNGTIYERDPDAAMAMVLNHCLARPYVDSDGKIRLWCEMPAIAITGTWSATASTTVTEDASSGSATTELASGDYVYVGNNLRTVTSVTDDDTFVVDSAVTAASVKVRPIANIHIEKHHWVTIPDAQESNLLETPDKIRIRYSSGEVQGSFEVLSTYGSGTEKIVEEYLAGCTHEGEAKRIAETKLAVVHLQEYVWSGVVCGELGAQIEPGDIVLFDTDVLTEQPARVLQPVVARPDGTYQITLREFDPEVYSESSGGGQQAEPQEIAFLSTGVRYLPGGARLDYDNVSGDTRLSVYDVDSGEYARVSVGAANSGGTGYKLLRIPNKTVAFKSSVDSQSTLSGDLWVSIVGLKGRIDEQETTTGDLSVSGGIVELGGSVVSSATIVGGIVKGIYSLAGAVSSQATVVGSLILPGDGLYYMRADGAAANKAAATGPETDAAKCMDISKHNSETFSPGDMIIVSDDGGDYATVSVQLNPPSSGSAGLPITYRGSGTPKFSAGAQISTWVASGTANVWKHTGLSSNPWSVWIDGTFGDYKTDDSLADEFDYLWDGAGSYYDTTANTLYLYCASGNPDTEYTLIERAGRDRCIYTNRDWIVFDGLTVEKASYGGFRDNTAPGDYVTIQNCTLQWCGYHGLHLAASGGSYTGWKIQDNICRWNGTAGLAPSYGCCDALIRRNTCYENNKYQTWQNWTSGIKLYDGQSTAQGNIIEHNKIYLNGRGFSGDYQGRGVGIWLDTVHPPTRRNIVRYNEIYDNKGNGIFIEITSDTDVYGNVIYDNASNDGAGGEIYYPAGITLDTRNDLDTSGNRIYNNTIYGGKVGIKLTSYSLDTGEISNNLVKNNIMVGCSIHSLSCGNGGDNDGTKGSGNIYSNNCMGAESSDFLYWSGSSYSTYDSWLAASPTSGKSDDNIKSDPSLYATGSDQYFLDSDSPCIDAGTDLGDAYALALHPSSSWPSAVVTVDQDDYDSWEVGAYGFPYEDLASDVTEQTAVTGDLTVVPA